ncbi:ATP-binding protein [Alkalibacter saccharofermentans]|uniref:histidine kinase n=1 Tax=Alkalibacter saccharofermentans DSM 14828 TaxID=1120975 RepID=A0A1M4VGB7_9FIRM|nr:ATP-binding protein [Alkalibacter saccharofermentans]SHE68029.1 Histidine kinase-, DNA gyrase B-, and HSP90-like ATPase [Alkalibacter saccharofermentans DSM 14828]
MKELSLHIMDIVENSIRGEASLIKLSINEDIDKNLLRIRIVDNGKGIPKDVLENVKNPFVTSRTTRPVGLGISLFEAAAKQCEGSLDILSKVGIGTAVKVKFKYDHIDRAPLGDMPKTITSVVLGLNDANLIYEHTFGDKKFILDTREIRNMIGEKVPLDNIQVVSWIKNHVEEELNELCS